MSAEIIELKAELIDEKPIISNLAEVQRRCLDLAEEYRKVGTISTYEDYQQAKRDRTMFNKAIKSIEDERRRVKTIWMAPYTTFEAGVKGALSPLREVADRNDAAIKTFERSKCQEGAPCPVLGADAPGTRAVHRGGRRTARALRSSLRIRLDQAPQRAQ